jgi:type IV pilus biogenesis protein PilP
MVSSSVYVRFSLWAVALITAYPVHSENGPEAVNTSQVAPAGPNKPGLLIEPQPQGETMGVLGRLYEQRLLIKAQVELMSAQAQLKTNGVTTAKISESYAPTVKMVQGVGDSLFATFLYPGNMTMDGRVGDVISGGFKVESISVHQVVLSKEGERMHLGFSASPPTPLPALGSSGSSVSGMAGAGRGNGISNFQ